MSKYLLHIIILLLGGSILVSCFDDGEAIEYNYNDLILTNVAFGTLPRTMHTKNKAGEDSTFQSSVSANTVYPFTIDQINNVAYNLDSLPVGTRADKIIFSAFAVKDGSFGIKSLTTGQDTAYAVADTLDFRQGYREFSLFGVDGTSRRTYRVEVRIHQQKEDSVTWSEHSLDDFAAHYVQPAGPETEYSAAGFCFSLVPGESILVKADGQEESMEDAVNADDKQHLPTANVAWNNLPSRADANIEEVYLYGTRTEADTLAGKFWRRNISKNGTMEFAWDYYPTSIESVYPLPALRSARLFAYDKGLLLVGIDKNDKICVKYSLDRGRTWKKHTSLVLPTALSELTVTNLCSQVDADSNLWLLIDDTTVWRGRAHKVSWNDDQREYQ